MSGSESRSLDSSTYTFIPFAPFIPKCSKQLGSGLGSSFQLTKAIINTII